MSFESIHRVQWGEELGQGGKDSIIHTEKCARRQKASKVKMKKCDCSILEKLVTKGVTFRLVMRLFKAIIMNNKPSNRNEK
jgi:hypothetical protein